MNRLLLYLFMLPSGIYRRGGANVNHLWAILKVRVMMDDRKPIAWNQRGSTSATKKKSGRMTSIISAFISLAIGIFYTMPLFLMQDEGMGIAIYFTSLLALLSFSMITDFSNVLLDPRDKYVLLPSPVTDRTILVARLLHTFIYLTRLVLPLSIGGWVVMGILYGWKAAILFPLPLLLISLTSLFLVMGMYLILIRYARPGKFQSWLSSFQIVFSILIIASFYIGPQLLKEDAIMAITTENAGFLKAIPSFWISTIFSWVKPSIFLIPTRFYNLGAVLFPLVSFWVMVRFLAPNFVSRLAAIDAADSSESPTTKQTSGKKSIAMTLARLFNKSKEAQAGFLMAWWQSSRSRTFKMRVYPSLAYVPLYFVYILTTNSNHLSLSEAWHQLGSTRNYLFLLYITSFVLLQALNYLVLSDQYKASWVYHAAPLMKPGYVMAGALKAAWIKYFLPFFIAIGSFVLAKWGLSKWLDVLLALVNVSLFSVCMAYFTYRTFPFSQMESKSKSSGKVFRTLLTMSIPAALGFGHYLAVDLWWLKSLYLLLSLILLWMVWDSYRNTGWHAISNENET